MNITQLFSERITDQEKQNLFYQGIHFQKSWTQFQEFFSQLFSKNPQELSFSALETLS